MTVWKLTAGEEIIAGHLIKIGKDGKAYSAIHRGIVKQILEGKQDIIGTAKCRVTKGEDMNTKNPQFGIWDMNDSSSANIPCRPGKGTRHTAIPSTCPVCGTEIKKGKPCTKCGTMPFWNE